MISEIKQKGLKMRIKNIVYLGVISLSTTLLSGCNGKDSVKPSVGVEYKNTFTEIVYDLTRFTKNEIGSDQVTPKSIIKNGIIMEYNIEYTYKRENNSIFNWGKIDKMHQFSNHFMDYCIDINGIFETSLNNSIINPEYYSHEVRCKSKTNNKNVYFQAKFTALDFEENKETFRMKVESKDGGNNFVFKSTKINDILENKNLWMKKSPNKRLLN